MGLRDLSEAGIPEVLDAAAEIVVQNGLAKGLRHDPSTGSVDIVAAIAIALGAKPKSLTSSVSLLDTGVPPAAEAKLHATFDVLDALVEEVETWCDLPEVTAEDVGRLLRKAAMRLRVAVI
jgi:hypothetical protein